MMTLETTKVLNAIRVGLVVVAAVIFLLTILHLVSMTAPPPNSDGFVHGMAGAIGGGILLLALGIATLTIITPSVLGRADSLGFNRWQRLAMKGVGLLIGVGLVLALFDGLNGVVLLLGLLVVAFCVVCAMLLWRFAEWVLDRRSKRGGLV